ncbi:MAG: helix-turn-helix domain-containing protein [Planctomycetota bacterium]|jgi:ribosome-binding protein aMBF1 (putative translation factor)
MHGETRRDVRAFVGARIREVRERRGMGIVTLSELSDIPEFMVRALEGGRMQMRFENLLCLARALGVGVTAFLETGDAGEADADPDGPGR